MHQEIAFLGLYIPALFFCAIAASVVWFVIDGVMLRLAAWDLFFHPPPPQTTGMSWIVVTVWL